MLYWLIYIVEHLFSLVNANNVTNFYTFCVYGETYHNTVSYSMIGTINRVQLRADPLNDKGSINGSTYRLYDNPGIPDKLQF